LEFWLFAVPIGVITAARFGFIPIAARKFAILLCMVVVSATFIVAGWDGRTAPFWTGVALLLTTLASGWIFRNVKPVAGTPVRDSFGELRGNAGLKRGMWFGMTPGTLELVDSNLRFTRRDGQLVFDYPIGQLRNVTFPGFLAQRRGQLQFDHERTHYRLNFRVRDNVDIVSLRRSAHMWRDALTQHGASVS
jgi:hypothetical protein